MMKTETRLSFYHSRSLGALVILVGLGFLGTLFFGSHESALWAISIAIIFVIAGTILIFSKLEVTDTSLTSKSLFRTKTIILDDNIEFELAVSTTSEEDDGLDWIVWSGDQHVRFKNSKPFTKEILYICWLKAKPHVYEVRFDFAGNVLRLDEQGVWINSNPFVKVGGRFRYDRLTDSLGQTFQVDQNEKKVWTLLLDAHFKEKVQLTGLL